MGLKKKKMGQKEVLNKTVQMNSNVLIIPIHENAPNFPIKRQRYNRVSPVVYDFQETHLKLKA